jgi:2-keto-4-pentenoate hydratase
VVVGAEHHKPGAYDLRLVGMAMQKNGEIVAAGSGADVMDHPANAVAWLANKMGSLGEKLEAGHLILPGSLCAAIAVVRGDKVMAKFHQLGIVEITFV